MKYISNFKLYESSSIYDGLKDFITNLLDNTGFYFRLKTSGGKNQATRIMASAKGITPIFEIKIAKFSKESGDLWANHKMEIKSKNYRTYKYSDIKNYVEQIAKYLDNNKYKLGNLIVKNGSWQYSKSVALTEDPDCKICEMNFKMDSGLPSFKNSENIDEIKDIFYELKDDLLDIGITLNVKSSKGYCKLNLTNFRLDFTDKIKDSLIESTNRYEMAFDSHLMVFILEYIDTTIKSHPLKQKQFKIKEEAFEFIKSNIIRGFTLIFEPN